MTYAGEIKFCNTTWTLLEIQPDDLPDDDGVVEFDTQTIKINAALHPHRKRVALVHELLHILYDFVGVEKDEKLVRQLEHGIYELVHRFPEAYTESDIYGL